MMENRVVRIEVKLEIMERTLQKTVNILEELIKSEVQQKELEKRIQSLETIISRLNWMVVAAVGGAILNLVIK
ncbi:MAG: hypothetical protein IBX44_02585 [Sulfurospirillum sp.]|nr:hypothetical protein [Sulfurospirillum sp.]